MSVIRVVLVDPCEESRKTLQRMLSGISEVWLAEVCSSYGGAANSAAEILPDVTIISMDHDTEQAMSLIQAIVKVTPDAVILPAGQNLGSDLLMRLMEHGVRRVLPLPTEIDTLLKVVQALKTGIRPTSANDVTCPKMVSITGAAGGMGCTILSTNLGVALARANPQQSVVLVDFDLLFGTVDSCLDIIPDHTTVDVLRDLDKMDLPLMKRSLIRHESGLYVLPHPVSMEDSAKIDADALRKMLGMLKVAFDTVIVDCSKGLQTSDILAYELSDLVLMVVQLDLNCLRNTARLLELLRLPAYNLGDRIRIVVNRAGSHTREIGVKRAGEVLGIPVSWQIPNDTKTCGSAMSRGVPIDVAAKNSPIHRSICDVAQLFQKPPEEQTSTVLKRSRVISFMKS